MKGHIRGRDAAHAALENNKRNPIALEPASPDSLEPSSDVSSASRSGNDDVREQPPRVKKPRPNSDQLFALTKDTEKHRADLRKVFGTASEDFSQTMLGKLVALLRPNPMATLSETAVNAAIALIASMKVQNETQAVLAVEITGIAFAGQHFLRQSQHHQDEIFINTYGTYGLKLLRLQVDMMQVLERLQRGNKRIVEIHHIHSSDNRDNRSLQVIQGGQEK